MHIDCLVECLDYGGATKMVSVISVVITVSRHPLDSVFLTSCSVSLYLTAGLTLFFCTRLWPNFCRVKHEAEGATMSGLTSVLKSSSRGEI